MREGVPLGPVLAEVGAVNAMFVLDREVCDAGRVRLGGAGLTPEVVGAEVARTRVQLAQRSGLEPEEVEWRVAASLFHLGLASRVLSPVLGAALCRGVGVDARLMSWDPGRRSGSIVLATGQQRAPVLAGDPVGPGGAVEWVAGTVVHPREGVLGRAEAALRGAGRIAPRLLRGNVASAVAGAVRSLGRERPALAAAGERVAAGLSARADLGLSGAGTGPAGREGFCRRTCCLYYRLPGGGLCRDCALR